MASSFTLLVGVALLAVTAARLASALGAASPTSFLLGAYVLAHTELLLVALGLSLFRAFTPAAVIATLAVLCAVTLAATGRARRRTRGDGELVALSHKVGWRAAVRTVAADPVLIVLAAVVALGLAYVVALAVGTPQVEDDVLTFHLVRAGLWRQHHGITYLHGIFDLRNNAYPPGGELGALTSMTLAGNERFVALDQLLACLALAVGVVGIARRIGFAPRRALFSGLLVATLPLVVLQAGTAMSDLTVAAFLLAAAFFLLDPGRWSPWLAGVATALAVDVKLTAPMGIPVLVALAWKARPVALRRARLVAVAIGAVLGAFWYAVNLVETRTWDGHVTDEFHVDHGPASILARIARLGIEFIDLSGATGRDRRLYAVAAVVVALIAGVVVFTRRAAIATGAVAALLVLVPIALPPVAHLLVRAYFKTWVLLGRRDLADLDPGHDITRAAANFSWYGPLGSLALLGAGLLTVREVRRGRLDRLALLCVLAPLYWLLVFSALFFYQEWAGRFFAFPVALAAATWGLLLDRRGVAWAVTAVAATTLLLALANDARRPSGLALLQRDKPRSIWRTPGWAGGPETRRDYDAPVRFLAEHVPRHAAVGLAITPSDPVYPFFGSGLGHRIVFVHATDRDAPAATWVFVRPRQRVSLCAHDWQTVAVTTYGWRILRRTDAPACY